MKKNEKKISAAQKNASNAAFTRWLTGKLDHSRHILQIPRHWIHTNYVLTSKLSCTATRGLYGWNHAQVYSQAWIRLPQAHYALLLITPSSLLNALKTWSCLFSWRRSAIKPGRTVRSQRLDFSKPCFYSNFVRLRIQVSSWQNA